MLPAGPFLILLFALLIFGGAWWAARVLARAGHGARRSSLAVFALFALVATICAQKIVTAQIEFDNYLVDVGSFATNDTVHVAATRTTTLVPLNSPVMVHTRYWGLTNATDWVERFPTGTSERLTIADLPADYYVPNASSNHVLVTVDYVPPSIVFTNLVLTVGGKLALGATNGVPVKVIVLPRTQLLEEL